MKILYYDCFCGISGDMNLGALLDLGVEEEYLRGELAKLGLVEEYRIVINKEDKMGIRGTKVDVVLTHDHEHDGGHRHHRNMKDIGDIINRSSLGDTVKRRGLDMFTRIARAEARVHGKDISEIHFHEVGAIDSIVDIMGAAIALDYLKVERILCSTVQLGGGFVRCAHGLLPVPAPATVEILQGVPVKKGLADSETTTPTGAAILASFVSEFTDSPRFTILKTGYGLGSRDLEVPNALRVHLAEPGGDMKPGIQFMIETNIDDMNPELFGHLEERLFAAGALDVFRTPVIMKKGRLAVKLSVLADSSDEEKILDVIFRQSTSIGVRKYPVEKTMLERNFIHVMTPFGEVRVKEALYRGAVIKAKPEYEDCRSLAEEHGVPITEIYGEVGSLLEERRRRNG
jgi:uncharacterized protein (TIGR00299 family) protein